MLKKDKSGADNKEERMISALRTEQVPFDENGNLIKLPKFDFTELDQAIAEVEEEMEDEK